MTSTAIVFMIISMVLIWGGLASAMIHLVKNPDKSHDELGLNK